LFEIAEWPLLSHSHVCPRHGDVRDALALPGSLTWSPFTGAIVIGIPSYNHWESENAQLGVIGSALVRDGKRIKGYVLGLTECRDMTGK
jgi:hypothetical protein